MDNPLISIIMPTYNRIQTLPASISSVLQQTYTNWELIVVDDRSTDDTKALISDYEKKDPRIRYLYNIRKKGPAAARNLGIENSRGEYLAFLDSDDEWFSHHLEDSINALRDEGVNVCFSLWIERNNKTGEEYKVLEAEGAKEVLDDVIREFGLSERNNRIVFPSPQFYEVKCLKTVHVCHINTMLINKEVIRKVGLLNEKILASEDTDFMYRIFYEFPFCLIKNYHFIYNQGEDNIHNFIDRHMLDLDKIINHTEWVRKLTFCGIYKCEMLRTRQEFIKKSPKIKKKDLCIQKCNSKIEAKFFTLGFINKNVSRSKALYYLMKSMRFKMNIRKFKLLVNILFPFIYKDQGIILDDLWLN